MEEGTANQSFCAWAADRWRQVSVLGDEPTCAAEVRGVRARLAPVTIVAGHYGVGKTNFALNLALDAAEMGYRVTLADMDVVNPYFRSSDSTSLLQKQGIRVIAPVFAGTTVEGSSVTGEVAVAALQAYEAQARVETCHKENLSVLPDDNGQLPVILIVDAGGDDAGVTALGQFAAAIGAGPYDLLYVVNERRNLTQEPQEAVRVLHEIEKASHLRATAVLNNTHLQAATDEMVIQRGIAFAEAVAQQLDLPLACSTVPQDMVRSVTDRQCGHFGQNEQQQTLYPVQVYVRTPWE